MRKFFTGKTVMVAGLCFLTALLVNSRAELASDVPAYNEGIIHYEHNDADKAIKSLKEALVANFTEPPAGKMKEAIELSKDGQTEKAEEILRALFDDEKTAARARYELGLIYENANKLDAAAAMLRDAAIVIADNGAGYVGADKCKICHIKQYNSWKTTKMAKTFDVLKPAAHSEAKVKLGFDPQKDYTKDAKCLACHTTGFGLPGGYKIPQDGDTRAIKAAKGNEGTTCEACHGPGSKFLPIHKDIMTKKQYTQKELYQAGQYEIKASVCTTCHNMRNPTAGPDYHFDYEKHKTEDTHENFPLKYRLKE